MKKQAAIQEKAQAGGMVSAPKYPSNVRRNHHRIEERKGGTVDPSKSQEASLVSVNYSNMASASRRQKAKSAEHYRASRKDAAMNATFVRVDTPDDVFDMFERYTTEEGDLVTIKKSRSIDGRLYTIAGNPNAGIKGERDGAVFNKVRNAGREGNHHISRTNNGDEANETSSDYNFLNLIDNFGLHETFARPRPKPVVEEPNITTARASPKGNDYILGLIDKLKLREVVEQIQKYPSAKSDVPSKEKDTNDHFKENSDLLQRLEREQKRTKELQRQLDQSEKQQCQAKLEYQKNIAALEVKLLLQENAHDDHISQDQDVLENLGGLLHSKPELRALRAKGQETIDNLEREVALLQGKNESLEETLEGRLSAYDSFVKSANSRIKEIQENEALVNSGEQKNTQIKELETRLANKDALIKSDREKILALELAAAKNATLLEAEKKRTDALEQLNQKLKLAMKRLSKKAALLSSAQQQIVALTKELEKRGKVMTSIKQILTVNDQSIPGILYVDGVSQSSTTLKTEKRQDLRPTGSIKTLQNNGNTRTDPPDKQLRERRNPNSRRDRADEIERRHE